MSTKKRSLKVATTCHKVLQQVLPNHFISWRTNSTPTDSWFFFPCNVEVLKSQCSYKLQGEKNFNHIIHIDQMKCTVSTKSGLLTKTTSWRESMSSITSEYYSIVIANKLLSNFCMHHPWLYIDHIYVWKLSTGQFEYQILAYLQKVESFTEKLTITFITMPHKCPACSSHVKYRKCQ